MAIMPPMVARLAVEMSGANWRPCGCSCCVEVVEHDARLDARPSARRRSISRTRLRYLEESRMTPGADRLARLRRAAAARRQRHAEAGQHAATAATTSSARPRQDDAERHDLVDAGVGGVEGPAEPVEADLAGRPPRATQSLGRAADPRVPPSKWRCLPRHALKPRHPSGRPVSSQGFARQFGGRGIRFVRSRRSYIGELLLLAPRDPGAATHSRPNPDGRRADREAASRQS